MDIKVKTCITCILFEIDDDYQGCRANKNVVIKREEIEEKVSDDCPLKHSPITIELSQS